MTPGEHEIKVEFISSKVPGVVLASGSFKLIKKEGDKVKIGRSFSYIKEGELDSDKELKAGILKSIRKHGEDLAWDEIFTDVKITSDDWSILQNKNSGAVTGRVVEAYCFASYEDGHCTIQAFGFVQQFNGTGYNKNLHYRYIVSGTQRVVDCE
ncbi:MAG: hypothetical protein GY756_19015 [bacterium]|nr:hypothetical protein [bacterium]